MMIESRLLFQETGDSRLGGVTLAGLLGHNEGVRDRIFGSYALVYVLEGGGLYRDANRGSLPIQAGDILLLFPEIAHGYGPLPGGRWSELYLVFSGPAFDLWRREGLLDPARPVGRLAGIPLWLPRLTGLVESLQRQDANLLTRTCRVQAALAEVLTAAGLIAERREDQEPLWLTQAKRLLREDLERGRDGAETARVIGFHPDAFRRRFTQMTGVSPSKYRMGQRVKAACQLLAHTEMTHRQIAEALGFGDEFYFSRRFKQIQGVSPKQFRTDQRRP